MSKGRDTKHEETAPEGASGSFGAGSGVVARDIRWVDYEVDGTITASWDRSAVNAGQPPSVRGVAYVNRETARKLLQGMIKEFREHAARSEADGYMTDADNFNRWAEQGEAVLGLTLGGG